MMDRQRSSETFLFDFSYSTLNFFDFTVYTKAKTKIAESLYL